MVLRSETSSWLLKAIIALLGASSIAWSTYTIPFYRAETSVADTARRILLGQKYSTAQLDALGSRLDGTSSDLIRPSALKDVLIIRLRLAEAKLSVGSPSDFSVLDKALLAALAATPTDSYLWLTKYSLESMASNRAQDGVAFLRMSYSLGPNEAWIALRRNPLALKILDALPADLGNLALAEFAGLVRSHLYLEAVNIFVESTSVVQEELRNRLGHVAEGDRYQFDRVLKFRTQESGPLNRPSRPF